MGATQTTGENRPLWAINETFLFNNPLLLRDVGEYKGQRIAQHQEVSLILDIPEVRLVNESAEYPFYLVEVDGVNGFVLREKFTDIKPEHIETELTAQ